MKRRRFLATLPASVALLSTRAAAQPQTRPDAPLPTYPQSDPAMVRDVVGAAHRDLARVREIVSSFPTIVNAAWDWGFGDWETPLGAAAHTGQRDIAQFLIDNGARIDLFAAAMIGHLDTVRASLAACPSLARTRGPHGITLLAHARAGGEPAALVAAFLADVPDADIPEPDLPISQAERDALVGSYQFGPADADCFDIAVNRQLRIQRRGQSQRPLKRSSPTTFSPAGTPHVKIRFDAGSLIIEDGPRTITAVRI